MATHHQYMQSESSKDAVYATSSRERVDGERLRRTLAALALACVAAGCDVDGLLARPPAEVIQFARGAGIDLRDFRDLCSLLIQRLDALELKLAPSIQ